MQEAPNTFLDSISKALLAFVNNENYINLIGIFITAFITYRVAKYTTYKPERLSIKQSQLDNIYLPLFRLLEQMPQSPSRLDAFAYNKKIGNILDRHYVLAFPQLHRLNRTLKEQLVADLDYTETLQTIRHQVVIDYELLKKALGYPSESFRDLFIRMTPKQKLLYLWPWIDVLWIFIPLLLSIPFVYVSKVAYLIAIISLLIISGAIVRSLNDFAHSSS